MRCPVAFLLLSSAALVLPAAAQDAAEDLPLRILLGAESFDGTSTGEGGEPTRSAVALRLVLLRPPAEARRILLDVLERGRVGGQMYALCGLYSIDRPLFLQKVQPFLTDTREVFYCPDGCTISQRRVRDLVRSPSRYAVRLPEGFEGMSWEEWVEVQDWPRAAHGRADIFGGAFPYELSSYPAFGAPRDPQRSLKEWVARIDEDDPADEIGAGIAAFGYPALKVVAALAADERPLARHVAAEAVWGLGVDRLGLRAEEAAKLIAPLLHDAEPEVRLAAAQALYQLYPWARSADGQVVLALERLPEELQGETAESLREFAEYLVDDLAILVGEPAVPALAALFARSRLRGKVGSVLGELAGRARAARSTLAKHADQRSALLALGRIGLEPGSEELKRVADLLRTADEDVTEQIAGLLSGMGPAVAGDVAEPLRLAQTRFADRAQVSAALSLARWKIEGEQGGLVAKLVAAAADPSQSRERALVNVLRAEPRLLSELAPFLRSEDAVTRRVALRVAERLGSGAQALEESLRRAVAAQDAEDPRASQAALTLLAVTGDAAPALRIGRRLVEARDRKAASVVLRKLDAQGAPLIEPVLAWAKQDPRLESAACRLLAAAGSSHEERSVPFLEGLAKRNTRRPYSVLSGLVRLAEAGSKPAADALVRLAAVRPPTSYTIAVQEAVDRLAAR